MLRLINHNAEPFNNLLTAGEELLKEIDFSAQDEEYQDEVFARLSTYYGLMYRLDPEYITVETKLRAPRVNQEIISRVKQRFRTLSHEQAHDLLYGCKSLLDALRYQVYRLPQIVNEDARHKLFHSIQETSLSLGERLIDESLFLSNLELMVDLGICNVSEVEGLESAEDELRNTFHQLKAEPQLLLAAANELEWLLGLVQSSSLETDPVVSELWNVCSAVGHQAALADNGLLDDSLLELRSIFNIHVDREPSGASVEINNPPRMILAADDGQTILDFDFDEAVNIKIPQQHSSYRFKLTQYSKYEDDDDEVGNHRLGLKVERSNGEPPDKLELYGLKTHNENSIRIESLSRPETPNSLYFDVTHYKLLMVHDEGEVVFEVNIRNISTD